MRVVIISFVALFFVSIVSVCAPVGTKKVSGLQSFSSNQKSEKIWHTNLFDSAPSSFGVISMLILHSVFSVSQVYSFFGTSSFPRRYVGCCHAISVTTLVGSMVVSGGLFLRRISYVCNMVFFALSRIFIVSVCSHSGTIEVFGLHGSLVGTISKSDVMSQVRSDDSAPSSIGTIFRFILHSSCSGSQLYTPKEVSSFKSR